MKAVIMAGGEGTRLRPLTCELPKPLVPIVNRPVMEHIIRHLHKHGINKIAATLHYLPGAIKRTFGDGEQLGVDLTYEVENKPVGTAGSVRLTKSMHDDDFVVISGDCLTDIDISSAISFHKQRSAMATIILKKVNNPLEYGIVVTDGRGSIIRFLEKPGWGEVFSDTANTGIYVLSNKIFNIFPEKENLDFSKDIFPILLQRNEKLFGFITDGYWCDIGEPAAYKQANIDALDGALNLTVPGTEIRKGVWLENDIIISSEAKITGPCAIAGGCNIGSGAVIGKHTVLGQYVNIGNDCKIERSIIWEGCNIGAVGKLSDCLVLSGTKTMENVTLLPGSIVGSECIIRENSTVARDVSLWPGKKISAGTEVRGDYRAAKYMGGALFGQHGITGTANYDITVFMMARLGAAFGSFNRIGAKILAASDGSNISVMLLNALSTGMQSCGLDVADAGEATLPAIRRNIIFSGSSGGVFVYYEPDNKSFCKIVFLDESGKEIGKSDERKIENIYSRSDFRNCLSTEVREIKKYNDCMKIYGRIIVNMFKTHLSNNNKYSVALCTKGIAFDVVRDILEEAGVTVLRAENLVLHGCAHFGCSIGVIIDKNCEKLSIVDSKCNIASDDMIYSIAAIAASDKNKTVEIRVPVTASSTVDETAKKCGIKTIQTRISNDDLLKKMDPVQFDICFDPPAGVLRILSFMSESGQTVDELIKKLPIPNIVKDEVECPWEMKGILMRTVIENNAGIATESKEGVRCENDRGWVLFLPDYEKPVFHIYAESSTIEASKEIAINSKEMLESFKKQN